jgi:hypothetical protein
VGADVVRAAASADHRRSGRAARSGRPPSPPGCFDLLQDLHGPLLAEPLSARRQRLGTLLADAPPQLGCVRKPPTPTRRWAGWMSGSRAAWKGGSPRGWRPPTGRVDGWGQAACPPKERGGHRRRHRHRFGTGPVLLGRLDETDTLRCVGRTRPLTRGQRGEIAASLSPPRLRRSGRAGPSVAIPSFAVVDRPVRRHHTPGVPSGGARSCGRGRDGRRVRVRPVAAPRQVRSGPSGCCMRCNSSDDRSAPVTLACRPLQPTRPRGR